MVIPIKITQSNSASLSWIAPFLFNVSAADFVNEAILMITFGLLTVMGLVGLRIGCMWRAWPG